jgi:hypothetical protein
LPGRRVGAIRRQTHQTVEEHFGARLELLEGDPVIVVLGLLDPMINKFLAPAPWPQLTPLRGRRIMPSPSHQHLLRIVGEAAPATDGRAAQGDGVACRVATSICSSRLMLASISAGEPTGSIASTK